jgi:hypothetical protein
MKYRKKPVKEKIVNLEVTLIVRCRYDTDAALSEARRRLKEGPPWVNMVSGGSDGSFSLKAVKTESVMVVTHD